MQSIIDLLDQLGRQMGLLPDNARSLLRGLITAHAAVSIGIAIGAISLKRSPETWNCESRSLEWLGQRIRSRCGVFVVGSILALSLLVHVGTGIAVELARGVGVEQGAVGRGTGFAFAPVAGAVACVVGLWNLPKARARMRHHA